MRPYYIEGSPIRYDYTLYHSRRFPSRLDQAQLLASARHFRFYDRLGNFQHKIAKYEQLIPKQRY